jgi:predicted transcriptional regulator
MSFSTDFKDHKALLLLREIVETITYRIITSTMDTGKTVPQISRENNLPLSSTYKKINRLYKAGILSIDKVSIEDKGKKVLYYRSRIRAIECSLNEEGLAVHLTT